MNINSLILVTGSSGMVGKSLVNKLKNTGFNNLVLPTSDELNLIDQNQTNFFFKKNKFDYVIHLAGKIGGIAASIAEPVEFLYENMTMGFNVINACHKNNVNKLLFLGSSCIYPLNSPQPMQENFLLTGLLEPTNEGYSLAKISGIKLCEYMNRQYGRDYLCLIPPNLYGYHDHFNDKGSHVISSLIYKFHTAKLNNEPSVEVWGSGLTKRELMFVDDISDAIIYFMMNSEYKKVANVLNVGTGHEISIYDLAILIKEIIDYKGAINFNTNKPDGMPKKLMDNSTATSLGWKPAINLKEGLKLTYEWYKKSLEVSK